MDALTPRPRRRLDRGLRALETIADALGELVDIRRSLAAAPAEPDPDPVPLPQRTHTIDQALDDLRREIGDADRETLFYRLTLHGHRAGLPVADGQVFATVTRMFFARVLGREDQAPELSGDPELTPFFDGVDRRRLERHFTALLIALTGGPKQYGGRAMDVAHAHLGITPRAWDLVVGHLVAVLVELNVPGEWIAEVGDIAAVYRPAIVTAPDVPAPAERAVANVA